MAEKRAPAPLPPPSSVPQVSVPSGVSLGSLRGIGRMLSHRHEESEQERERQPEGEQPGSEGR